RSGGPLRELGVGQRRPSAHWKQTHNHLHNKYTNILGMDDDVGYGLLRVTVTRSGGRSTTATSRTTRSWRCCSSTASRSSSSSWAGSRPAATTASTRRRTPRRSAADREATLKDYVVYPALTGKAWKSTLTARTLAGVIRTCGPNAVIFCGSLPGRCREVHEGGRRQRDPRRVYLRQMLGSANISGGRVMAFMTGNLSYQIEPPHLPGSPSNRYAEIAVKVRALCEKYDLPYTTGPLPVQYEQVVAHHRQAVAAEQVPQGHAGRCARDGVGAQVRRQHHRDDRSGDG
ncbi:acyl-CoA desaturase, partial [Rhodococcus hoagii]|nr:acyl-CoA desaturase [Prescottella equi]